MTIHTVKATLYLRVSMELWGVPTRSQDLICNKTHHLLKKCWYFLFNYKVHTLRSIVEHNIRQMSPTTLLAHTWYFLKSLNLALFLGHPIHVLLPPKSRYDNFNTQNPSVQSVRYIPGRTIRSCVPALHHHGLLRVTECVKPEHYEERK
jgi:hypothetical protein